MSAFAQPARGGSTAPIRGAEPARSGGPGRGARRYLFTALAIVIGAVAGGLYAYFVGCTTGTCPLTQTVSNASLAGGVMGALIGWPGRRRE